MEEKSKKIKKAVKAGAAATVAAASLLVNGAVEDPSVLLHPENPDESASHVLHVDAQEHRSYIVETDRLEPLTFRQKACLWMQRMPLPVRALVLLPLWGVGEALTVLGTALLSSPIGQAVLHLLLELALLIGLFALVWKLLFPDVPLRKLFSKKNLPWLIGGAILITAANTVLGLVWDQWKFVRAALLAVIGLLVLMLLWYRLCSHLPGPKRKRQKVELVVK